MFRHELHRLLVCLKIFRKAKRDWVWVSVRLVLQYQPTTRKLIVAKPHCLVDIGGEKSVKKHIQQESH